MISISVCIIARNNKEFIERAINGVKDIGDEIIVVDYGSIDKTKEIASRLTENVFDFKWNEDISEVKNFALSKATKDYILWIEPQDVLEDSDIDKIREIKETSELYDGYYFNYIVCEDENLKNKEVRLFKNNGEFKWSGMTRESLISKGNIEEKPINIYYKKSDENIKTKKEKNLKILVGSPIHQDKDILREFLLSLEELDKKELQVDYYFVDDNQDEDSKKLLKDFQSRIPGVIIDESGENSKYFCDDYTHRWTNDLIAKITRFKNGMIKYAIEKGYDYIFFIDSDIVLNPKTLKRLIQVKKDIVSNIFWTKWNPNVMELPQVWLKDAYTLYDAFSNESLSQNEISNRQGEFINMLRKPGTYRVGGLGACTLINREAMLRGVSFDLVYNISFWGEDRHFCIRAVSLGLDLWVDTFYPAFHIYRKPDLARVDNYKKDNQNRDNEIVTTHIYGKVEQAIKKLETCSYKEEIDNSWEADFTEAGLAKARFKYRKNKKKLEEDKVINNAKVEDVQIITFNDKGNVARVRFKLVHDGYKNDFSYHKEFKGRVVIVKQEDENWLIDDLTINREVKLNFAPMVRRVRENPKITLSMIVKNEADRYLERVLSHAAQYVDEAVIIDDGSTDNTVEICERILKNIPHKIIVNDKSEFANEINLRKQQWNETLKMDPDWILCLDADEIFEDKFGRHVRELMKNQEIDVFLFRLYDFWNESHYRDDKYWCAHNTYRHFMIRYQPNFKYQWKETAQHCGRLPANLNLLTQGNTDLRLKHMGWARLEDRLAKYNRYMELDPDARFGWKEQYDSILDETPNLVKWEE